MQHIKPVDLGEAVYNQILPLSDGRNLGYAIFGDPCGTPVFYFHGLPASRYEAAILNTEAEALGVQVIAPDRPGYGLSSPRVMDNLMQWPTDVIALADYLELEQFSVIGLSGGGPFALAAAAAIPERLSRVVVVAGLGPVYLARIRRKMGVAGVVGFSLAARNEILLRLIYGNVTASVLRRFPKLAHSLVGLDAPQADRDIFKSAIIRGIFEMSVAEALQQDATGAVRDFCLLTRDWGFEPKHISIPVHLWYGDADRVVPMAHGQFYAAEIPQVVTHFQAGEGHFSMPVRFQNPILADIKAGHVNFLGSAL